ncbi:hypothetical protein GGI12_005742, partial [Dipsacomyces acuminosporus]
MHARLSNNAKLGVLAVLSLLLSTAYAGDQKVIGANTADGSLGLTKHGGISASGIVAGVILLIVGLFFNYLGVKIIKLLIFLTGFCVIGGLVLYAEYKIRPPRQDEKGRAIGYLVGAGVLGLLGGALLIFLYKVGIALLGGLGGFAIASWILSLKSGGLIPSEGGRIGFIIGFVVLGIVAILFLERPAIIVASSIWGAYALFIGIDCFARTGFQDATLTFLKTPGAKFTVTPKVYGMIAGMAVSAVLGIIIQFII